MSILKLIKYFVFDTYTDGRGYKRFKENNQLVHRVIAEKKLGRKLRNGEVVHHIDRDKKNNSMKNLWVYKNQAEHDEVHRRDAKKYGSYLSYNGFNKKSKVNIWSLFRKK